MHPINILVIEDLVSESQELLAVLQSHNYNVVGVATNYKEALTLFYEKKVDLVIIDVFLNGQPDGITFAETISITPHVLKPFVFLTSSKDRQIFERAKLTKPFSFLLKPFNKLEVLYAIEMAIEKFYDQRNVFQNSSKETLLGQNCFFVKKKNALRKIDLEEIIYIGVDERYCNIITRKDKYMVTISLTKIMELLDDKQFIRSHRNYIVNTKKIIEIQLADNLIITEGDHKITLSDKYKEFIRNFQILR